jgi:hypothetical protein
VLPEPEPVVPEPFEPVPQVLVAEAPTITQIGSSPIILHLGGTPYIEQGAVAYCEIDGDISANIVIIGNVDTTRAGTYQVTYSVTNSAGLSSNITRDVRILSPTEQRSPRETFRFNGQGKVVSNFTYNVTAHADGVLSITVAPASKTSVDVRVTDSTGTEVLNHRFASNASRDVNVAQGNVTIRASIVVGNGNTNFTLTAVTPEVVTMTFPEQEVPLAPIMPGLADTTDNSRLLIFIIIAEAVIILGLGATLLLVLFKRQKSNQ